MTSPTLIVLIRFKSRLPLEQIMQIVEDRAGEFRALTGLQQKYYVHDPGTGEVGGLYLWESAEALAEYQESALKATIAEAYQVEGEPRIEVYQVVKTLRETTD